MEIFWLISDEARVKLIQYQHRRYKTKLDMAGRQAPWERKPPSPRIPVRTGMTDDELSDFMERPPSRPEKVD